MAYGLAEEIRQSFLFNNHTISVVLTIAHVCLKRKNHDLHLHK